MRDARAPFSGAMLLMLAAVAGPHASARAEAVAVVVSATAPGFKAGQHLGTEPISVPDGASLIFLVKSGQLVTVKGPYEGPPPAPTDRAGSAFDRLARVAGTDQSEIGGTRSLPTIANPVLDLPLDLYVATDRGRYPVYRPGEPIRIVLQTNREAYAYCWLRGADRRMLLLFPSTAAEARPLPGGLTVWLPGTGQAGLAADPAFDDSQLRCMASTTPLDQSLVDSFLAAAGQALPAVVAERLDHAMVSLGDGANGVVLTQLVLKMAPR
ncbi:MAG: DUF4384 domain-containing protein [Geminicoccaceae bacterium]